VHRAAAQVLETEVIAGAGVGQEAVEARQVGWGNSGHLGAHRLDTRAHGEAATVLEADLVERVHRPQGHVAVEVAATGGPEVAQDLRDGDDGRPKVEAVALVGDRRAAAACPVEPVDDSHAPALGTKAHRGGKPAKPRADDEGMALGRECILGHVEDDKVSSKIYNHADAAAKQPLFVRRFFARLSA
jgi:hypothetical protein